jgi:hypothetical protein
MTTADPIGSRPEFVASRALLMRSDIFPPLVAKATRPLRDALGDGAVREDTPLLVLHRVAATIALVTRQLLFHHVVQGEVDGKPWLVSY